MASILMVESWLQSTGVALPRLIREHGHRYVLVTRDPATYADNHPVVRYADHVAVAETNDHATLLAAVRTLATERPIDGVLTTCDYYLETAALCAQSLQLPGPPPDVVRLATRKHLVRDATRRAGLPTPRYATAPTWESARRAAAAIGFPLVAKPVDLNSGTSVLRVDDDASLKDAFWAISAEHSNTRGQPLARLVLLEELLDGPEFSVETVTQNGTTSVLGITEKVVTPGFIELGHQFPARLNTIEAQALEDLVRRALDAIGLTHGMSHTEVKLTPDGPRLVEINPRQPGGYIFDLIQVVTGTNPLQVVIDLALGRQPAIGTPAAPLPRPGLVTSAAVRFLLPSVSAAAEAPTAHARLNEDPSVYRWELQTRPGTAYPRDNNDRIGHVLAVDHDGDSALDRANAAARVLCASTDAGT